MPLDIRKPSGSGKRIQLSNVVDFSGGLNLTADVFKLGPNESPEMMNVDINREGGFQLRRGTRAMGISYTTPAGAAAASLYTDPTALAKHKGFDGTELLIVQEEDPTSGTHLRSVASDGTMATLNAGNTTDLTGPCRFATYGGYMWVARQTQAANLRLRYNAGWSLQVLSDPATAGWSDNLASGSTTRQPYSKLVTSHQEYVWVANTLENSVAYKDRLRWSHPGNGGAWRKTDYVDVGLGEDGKGITAIVPYKDHLVIFKDESVWALYGYDAASFQLVRISDVAGAVSQEATCVTPSGIFFYDRRRGAYFYNGEDIAWLFGNVYDAIERGTISPADSSDVTAAWVNNRFWLNVPWDEAALQQDLTLVMDPESGEGKGGWMLYNLPCRLVTEVWDGTYASSGNVGAKKLVQVEVDGAFGDDLGSDTGLYPGLTIWPDLTLYPLGDYLPISAYYRTRWMDEGEPAIRKRWKRPDVVLSGESAADVFVDVFHDYDPTDPVKSFELQQEELATGFFWDAADWDTSQWVKVGQYSVIDRGATLGLARAVQLKFYGPPEVLDWAVDGFVLKYVPKKVR